MKARTGITAFLLCSSFFLQAQQPYIAGIDSTASIHIKTDGQWYDFSAALRPLQVIPGGRQPFYSYLWDFGDGHFSTEAEPRHAYAVPGDYTVQLYAVNNYDDGKRPPRPVKKKTKVDRSMAATEIPVSGAEKNFFAANGVFQLSKNANALPGEDMVITAGLRLPEANRKGTIIILANEKVYSNDGFVFRDRSAYNKEVEVSPDSLKKKSLWASVSNITITQSGSPHYNNRQDKKVTAEEAGSYFSTLLNSYSSATAYSVETQQGGSQFSFINFDIAPTMLKDTNAMLTITGIFLPADTGGAYVHQLEVPVVASHDPNKMSLKQSRLSYRLLAKGKEMLYKVQFQNDGEGDAKNIRLEIDLPANLDPTTFKLVNLSPVCLPCADSNARGCYRQYVTNEKTIVFHFKDISLPGTQAKDITNEDSTKGFIRFTVKPKRRLPNQAFKGKTLIFFDKNEPIRTNFATGRFRKSLSPIVFAGMFSTIDQPNATNKILGIHNKTGFSLGAGLSPLAPYKKPYWQVELYANSLRQETDYGRVAQVGTVVVDGRDYVYDFYDRTTTTEYLQLNLVPVQVRYNIGSLISVGAGALCKIDLPLSAKEKRTVYPRVNGIERTVVLGERDIEKESGHFRTRPFADINIGKVLLGPSLGARYIFDGKEGQFFQLYGAWRF